MSVVFPYTASDIVAVHMLRDGGTCLVDTKDGKHASCKIDGRMHSPTRGELIYEGDVIPDQHYFKQTVQWWYYNNTEQSPFLLRQRVYDELQEALYFTELGKLANPSIEQQVEDRLKGEFNQRLIDVAARLGIDLTQ